MEQPLASSSQASAPDQGTDPASAAPDKTQPASTLSLQDHQTLTQLRRGNWAAMDQLVQRYQDRLYVTLLRMVGHPEDAADLLQETFVRAMQGLARFEGKSTLYTWLFRIAVNLALSHRRAARYRSTLSLDGGADEDDGVNRQAAGLRRQLVQDTESDPGTNADQQMEYERLLSALSRLDPEFRAVIVLRDVEECDYEQMAAILDVAVGTIKSRLFRARAALREVLSPAKGKDADQVA